MVLPQLPAEVIEAHLLPVLSHGSLISIVNIYNTVCEAVFDQKCQHNKEEVNYPKRVERPPNKTLAPSTSQQIILKRSQRWTNQTNQ